MTLPESIQVSLGVLQTVGLLIPVTYLALRPYFPERLPDEGLTTSAGERYHKIDVAPQVMRWGAYAVGLLAFSGFFAAMWVLIYTLESWLVALSVLFLAAGLLMLALIFFKIRTSIAIRAV